MKLDSGLDRTMQLIDRPVNEQLTVKAIIERLQRFEGDFTLQTCFLRGIVPDGNGEAKIDNTTEEELTAWYQAIDSMQPKQIMIYVIDRKTPCERLEKIPRAKMDEIAAPLRQKGYDVIVSA